MRFLLVCMLAFALFACKLTPRPQTTVDYGMASQAPSDQGAVIFEVIHLIGLHGASIDRWVGARVATVELKPNAKPTFHSLSRIIQFSGDSAVFAGTLPAGLYRIVSLEGERMGPNGLSRYRVPVPEEVGEFFVGAGKLNSLGVLVQASVGDWSWTYHRDPEFDLPELVRHLRPDLAALDMPALSPDSLRARETEEPESRILRAFPTTPLIQTIDSGAMVGAQLGRIYHRTGHVPKDTTVTWDAVSLGSRQTVVDVLPVDTSSGYALTANGEVFELNSAAGNTRRLSVSLPGRIIKLGFFRNNLHVVTEQLPLSSGEHRTGVRFNVYRLTDRAVGDWHHIGEIRFPRSPHSIVFVDDMMVLTASGNPASSSSELFRLSLVDGTVEHYDVPVQMVRDIGGGMLAGADQPARWPDNMAVSADGGRTWNSLSGILPVGWPVRSRDGALIVPSRPLRRHAQFHASPVILRLPAGGEEWLEMGQYPTSCGQFMESGIIDGTLIVFCGERVLQFESLEYGWRKEALHELQSALP